MTSDVDAWLARGVDETVLWHGHPRKTSALPAVAAGVVIALVGLAIVGSGGRPALLLLVLLGTIVSVWGFLRVVNTEFVVTDRALYRKTGIRSRYVTRVALRRVQNSTFRQSVAGSTFGYGTIVVEAAGGGSIRFDDVVDPAAVRALIERETDADDIPGRLEQWESVLAETCALRRAFESIERLS